MLAASAIRRAGIVRMAETAFLVLIVVDFAWIVARLIGLHGALGWDEAVYAVRGRAGIDPAAPAAGWSVIRAPALPVASAIVSLFSRDESMLRTIGLVSGVGILLVVWWVGRMIAGPLAGLGAAAVMHGSPMLQQASAVLLTDAPAALLLLVAVGLVVRDCERQPRLGAALPLAAVASGLAFLTRYGVVLAVVPLVVAAGAAWWHRLRRDRRWSLAALGIATSFAVAHMAWSTMLTGAPLGVLVASREAIPPWEKGATILLEWLPFELAGISGLIAVVAGVLALPVSLAFRRVDAQWRGVWPSLFFLSAIGVANIGLLLVSAAHLELRYLIIATAVLVVAGSCIAAHAIRGLARLPRHLAVAAAAALVVASSGPSLDFSLQRTAERNSYYEPYRVIGESLALASASGPCEVIGADAPIVAWYSGCDLVSLEAFSSRGEPSGPAGGRTRWLVLFGPPDRIDTSNMTALRLVRQATAPPVPIRDSRTGAVLATAWALP